MSPPSEAVRPGATPDGVPPDAVPAETASAGHMPAQTPPAVRAPAGQTPDGAGSAAIPSAAGAPTDPAGTGIDPGERTPRSFHVSRQVLERARAAAYWLSRRGDGAPTTISELVEAALRHEVERLENKHNDGAPFPAVHGRLRTGPGAAGAERIRQAQRARHRPTDS